MKTRQTAAILLALLGIVSMSGCSSNEEKVSDESTASTSQIEVDENFDPMAKYEEPVEITMFRQCGYGVDPDTFIQNIWLKEYEEKLGIKVTYSLIGYGDDYINKVNLMTASGESADIMEVNLRQLYQMMDAESLQDIGQVWDLYASDQVKTSMTADGTQNFDMASKDGKLYAVPAVIPNRETVHAVAIREDWRKKLNLPEPETIDDLEKIMYAFAQQDPDGNGQDDTYGLGINKDLFTNGYEITSFCNAFGAYPKAWVEDESGNVVYGGIMDGMKPALTRLQQYYKDGLLDKEFTVKTEDKASEIVAKNQCGVYFGVQWAGFIGNAVATVYKEDENTEWKVYPIPTTDEGGAPVMWNTTGNFMAVNKDCENPEAIVKIANYVHLMGQGPQGEGRFAHTYEEWEALWAEWTTSPFAPETIHNNVQRWLDIEEARETGNTEKIDSNFLCRQLYSDMMRYWEGGRKALDSEGNESIDFAATSAVLDMCKENFFCALDSIESGNIKKDIRGSYVPEAMVEKQPTLDKLELESITRIITGEASVDSFDEYVESWKSLGGDEITQEMNNWYQSMK